MIPFSRDGIQSRMILINKKSPGLNEVHTTSKETNLYILKNYVFEKTDC